MKRRLFNVLVGVSLVLFIATVSLSLRTLGFLNGYELNINYLHASSDGQNLSHSRWSVSLTNGELVLDHGWEQLTPTGFADFKAKHIPLIRQFRTHSHSSISRWGMVWRAQLPQAELLSDIYMPQWFAVTLTALAPVIWLLLYVWRYRQGLARGRMNLCSKCGYDLRATPERCPECGEVPKKMDKVST